MRLDHLLSMENIDHNDGVVDDLYSYRQKPKDGERMYALEAEYRSHCCSILSDRKVIQKELRTPPHIYGGVAQLGEHLPCKQGVMGSIPIISTSRRRSAKPNRVKR